MLTDTIGAGAIGLIDMHPGCRLARPGATDVSRAVHPLADRMVENDDAIGIERAADEGFRRWIVDVAYLLVVIEVTHAGRMPDQREALAIEREAVCDRTAVEHRHLVRFRQRRRFRLARRRVERIGARLAPDWRQI